MGAILAIAEATELAIDYLLVLFEDKGFTAGALGSLGLVRKGFSQGEYWVSLIERNLQALANLHGLEAGFDGLEPQIEFF